MFDLVTDRVDRPFRDAKPGTRILSIVTHALLLMTIVIVPLMYASNQLPKVARMAVFIVAAPPPPPPPPPAPRPEPAESRPEPSASGPNVNAAPIVAPAAVLPEPPEPLQGESGDEGGVEGGVVGGVSGGIVGGLVGAPPPPPPPPPPKPAGPIRVGGEITTPALVRRVAPAYPALAQAAKLTGTVILEVLVDESGTPTKVTVTKSRGPLDRAAIDAVQQWRYSPLVLNGVALPFIVTVTVNFSLVPGASE